MPIAGQLNNSHIAQNEQAAQMLGNAGTKAISSNQFTYFAAFDGTNNDKGNLSLTGGPFTPSDPQQTNAAQLYDQVAAMQEPKGSGSQRREPTAKGVQPKGSETFAF